MSKTYSAMKVNIGNFILDTSTQMATLIGNWINDSYRDISRYYSWSSLINFDYTFSTVANTATYTLPTDFEQEIFVANLTDGSMLKGYTEGDWFIQRYPAYQAGTISAGTSINYLILREAGQIQLDPKPDAVKTIGMPYKKLVTALSGDTDTVSIPDIEIILEYRAISEALAYKKQYEKSEYYRQKSEEELKKRISQDKARRNIAYQRIPLNYGISQRVRMLGNNSYDTI